MKYKEYCQEWANKTEKGKFFCQLCDEWINHQRWSHFKLIHRY